MIEKMAYPSPCQRANPRANVLCGLRPGNTGIHGLAPAPRTRIPTYETAFREVNPSCYQDIVDFSL